MKCIPKTLMGVLIGGITLCGAAIGIGAANAVPDFLKKTSSDYSQTSEKSSLSTFLRGHRTKLQTKKASPRQALDEASSMQTFQCVLTYSDDWEYGDEAGVYTFDASSSIQFRSTFISDDYQPTGGAFFTDKYYIVTTMSEDWFTGEVDVYSYKYSRDRWEELNYAAQDIYSLYNCICYDAIDDRAYGYFYNDLGGAWGYMSLDNLKVSQIAETERPLVAVAIDESGHAYAIADNGYLYSINKRTGGMSAIGDTGLNPEYMQSAAFGTDGKLYWAASEAFQSGLYAVDTETGNASLVGEFPGTEEVCALYAIEGNTNPQAPAKASDLKVELSGIEQTFMFSFMLPTKSIGGSSLDGPIDYYVSVDGIQSKAGLSMPGTKVGVTLSVDKPGFHLIKVVLANEYGKSESTSIRTWIGVDEPKSVRNSSVERIQDNSILISWEAPEGGVNGGFFDSEMIAYTVTRLPEGRVVASNIHETSFIDRPEIASGQSLIRYSIIPSANGLEGRQTITDGIVIGNPYEVPVDFTFDSEEDYNIFTVIDNNETVNLDSGMWQYTPSGEAAGYVSGTKNGDDWLITPSVSLKARTKYIFSHDVLCYSDYWPEEYSVYIGTTPDIAGMNNQIVPSTTIWWDEYRTRTDTITVDNDGVYYFGFHATSDAGTAFFLIDNIKLRELYKLEAPSSILNLNVAAAENGQGWASVSFESPLKTVDGEDLNDPITVKILRDGIVIKTMTDVNPGETIEFEDLEAVDRQMNLYGVICANSYGDGPTVEAEVWVGLDAPAAPQDATVTLNTDGNPVISWEKPKGKGIHGGYVDNNNLSYTVAKVKDGHLVPIAEKINGFFCTDSDLVLNNEGKQEMIQYYIVPSSNITDEYGDNAVAIYISGKPYTLPFRESFKDNKCTNFWAFTGTNGEGWTIGDDFSIGSQDNDDGVLAYIPAVPEVTATAMSGKIDISSANDPKLTFYLRKMGISDNGFYDTDPSKDVLNIKVGTDNFHLRTISSIRLEEIKKNGEYLYYSIPLSEFDSQEFIVLAFDYEAVSARTPIMIDNVCVKEIRDFNAVAGEVNAPEAVEIFDPLSVEAEIANSGSNPLESVSVKLMRGSTVEAETIVDMLSRDQSKVVTLEANVTPEWGEEAELKVCIDAENDEVEADNTSVAFTVKIIYHARPEVTDLVGKVEGTELELSWSEPKGLSSLETQVTETFESYAHGDQTFGSWKSEDKSFWGFAGVKTIEVDGREIEIPNSDDAQAFMIFNPTLAGIDIENNPEWAPVSGHNLIVSFGDAANDDWEPNNDWLISPELSGKSQTISFWARTAAKKGRPDDIRILIASEIEYNNNGTVKSSCFTALEDGDITLTRDWEKYEFELPATTKYFAIRNLSEDGFAVLIDDITYEPYTQKTTANLEGYNVYFDGMLLNNTPITETTYTVSQIAEGQYTVRVVYDEGESEDSNAVSLRTLSISDTIDSASEATFYDVNGLKIKTPERGKIYIRRSEGRSSVIRF